MCVVITHINVTIMSSFSYYLSNENNCNLFNLPSARSISRLLRALLARGGRCVCPCVPEEGPVAGLQSLLVAGLCRSLGRAGARAPVARSCGSPGWEQPLGTDGPAERPQGTRLTTAP